MRRLILKMTLVSLLTILTVGIFSATGKCYFGFCDTCEDESWKRFDQAVQAGGNSCDGTKAFVQYCWQQCPTCRFCSNHLQWYYDTGCP